MTGKEFMRALANGEADIVQVLLDLLARTNAPYCVIGGLAVNAYAEPVVSLDLDIVVIAGDTEAICEQARQQGMKVERFPHSINLTSPRSDLRVQLQTDERYQDFVARATVKNVLGYEMRVARLEDVLQGKIWACQDASRRGSKRQKDLADISRIVEGHPALLPSLPESVRKRMDLP
jgi:hypothetical protein